MLYTENLRTLTHEDLMKSFIALPHRGDTNMYCCQWSPQFKVWFATSNWESSPPMHWIFARFLMETQPDDVPMSCSMLSFDLCHDTRVCKPACSKTADLWPCMLSIISYLLLSPVTISDLSMYIYVYKIIHLKQIGKLLYFLNLNWGILGGFHY